MAPSRHAEDTDFVAIFLAEQRQRAGLDRLVRGHQAGQHRLIGADLGIHIGFDRGDFVGGERLGMRKVEAQPIRSNQTAFLGHMMA